ncbi:MAG: protein kinase [Candidatus Eisenbacteria sp.]|nr:protein kinase [Candidatus Eisenbacteria bacterium]
MDSGTEQGDGTQILPAFATGTIITHYRVIERIGSGGMGEVYLAEDTTLARRVALKFLLPAYATDDHLKARFTREARATAALNHPNVVTIHEVSEYQGRPFLAMEYVGDRSLRDLIRDGECTLEMTIDFASRIADALRAAHNTSIVHRDVKPANVLLTPSGQPKLVDFGLAAIRGTEALTRIGTTLGTVGYMSPEQARGGEVDHRTDIWALGVVLYEMLTGRLPFTAEHDQAVIYAILNERPPPASDLRPDVPASLHHLVDRMLQKEPSRRPPDTEAVMAELEVVRQQVTPRSSQLTTAEKPPSIAVLPFVDMSPQKDQEHFCDGMTEELINGLTRLRGFRVASRTSAFQFKGKDCDIGEIGARLRVDTVLEGSVRKAGNRLRITAQLVNIADGYHLWSQKYDREMEDIFAIQDEIALTIVERLQVKLLEGEESGLTGRATEDLEAYSLYLKGRFFWNRRTPESLERALDCFQQAIERDPQYAHPYAGLADCHIILMAFGPRAGRQVLSRARVAAEKALELDETLSEAHTSLAFVREWDWDWAGAEAEYRRAIELNPGYPTAHQWYGWYLSVIRRHEEGIAEGRQALELDPISPIVGTALGGMYTLARRFDEAIALLRKVLEMEPGFPAALHALARTYLEMERYPEAMAQLHKSLALFPEDALLKAYTGCVYAGLGETEQAREILDELKSDWGTKHFNGAGMARLCMALGKGDEALEWFARAIEEKDYGVMDERLSAAFDGLRSDPRFRDLLRLMHLDR